MVYTIINTRNWDIAECMSPARFIEWTEKAPKYLSIEDWKFKCSNYNNCLPSIKCNLKKLIKEIEDEQ